MSDYTEFFWNVAASLLADPKVEKSTMMGYPCLRQEGNFFASVDPKNGDLIVKLSAEKVQSLIQAGTGNEFAPNGRKFREWVLIQDRDEAVWATLLAEAREFIARD